MRNAELKWEVVRRATLTVTFRTPHSAFRIGRVPDRPPLPRRQALGPRAHLGKDQPLCREDPAHRARARPVAAVSQQEGRVDLRAVRGDRAAHPAGGDPDRAAAAGRGDVSHHAQDHTPVRGRPDDRPARGLDARDRRRRAAQGPLREGVSAHHLRRYAVRRRLVAHADERRRRHSLGEGSRGLSAVRRDRHRPARLHEDDRRETQYARVEARQHRAVLRQGLEDVVRRYRARAGAAARKGGRVLSHRRLPVHGGPRATAVHRTGGWVVRLRQGRDAARDQSPPARAGAGPHPAGALPPLHHRAAGLHRGRRDDPRRHGRSQRLARGGELRHRERDRERDRRAQRPRGAKRGARFAGGRRPGDRGEDDRAQRARRRRAGPGMTVALVRELYQFNAWAQRRIFDALAGLPAEPYQRDLKSSHGGIHGTLCHIVWAEQLWLTRWLGAPPPAVPQGRDLGSLAEVRARWEDVETKRCQFLDALTEAKLTATLTVQPSTGGAYIHTYLQTLQHAVDHSSYHRGQIITLLRQLGLKPPSTGLILFYRERATGRQIPNF